MEDGLFLKPVGVEAALVSGLPVIETGFRQYDEYLRGHIPGAVYLDTTELEQPPTWNRRAASELYQILPRFGLNIQSGCIIYSRSPLPAVRAAAVLMDLGFRSVQVLDGGLAAWEAAGGRMEKGVREAVPRGVLGTLPAARGGIFIDLEQVRELQREENSQLICVRSRAEFEGDTSGYDWIYRRGRIPGSIWGGGGTHKDDVSYFFHSNGTHLPLETITRRWRARGISPGSRIVFYCGTGWRASAACLLALAAGWENVSVYDGGWAEWSLDPRNPIEKGRN